MDIDLVNQNLAKANLDKIKKQSSDIEHDMLKEKELKEACAGFEAIFLNTMIKSMRKSLPGDGIFKESHGMGILQKSLHPFFRMARKKILGSIHSIYLPD